MITVTVDPEFADAHENYPTRVAVTLKDGLNVERVVVYASGTAERPMSPAQLRDKFFDCAAYGKIAKPPADAIFATLSRLGEQSSLVDLWSLIRRG